MGKNSFEHALFTQLQFGLVGLVTCASLPTFKNEIKYFLFGQDYKSRCIF